MTMIYTPVVSRRTVLARSHAAMHRTQLLLSLCRHCTVVRVSGARTTTQAAWHADQQKAFLAWLDAGGFAQEDVRQEDLAPHHVEQTKRNEQER